MTNFRSLWWQFFLMFVYGDVVYAQTWKTVSSQLHTPVQPMLFQYGPRFFSTLVKIWDTCENILGKWFTAPPGKQFPVRLWEGIGLVCTRRFSFHKFYNFLLFNFLILIFFGIFFLPTTFTHTHNHDPRPTTSTHYPLPTKFSYTRVYIRLCKHGKRFLLLK